jgi:hypothetical protein
VTGLVLGAVVSAYGLHTLGSCLVAESVPYGFGLLSGALLTLLGAFVLLVGWRSAGRIGPPRSLPASLAGVGGVLALTGGLLGLPVDDTSVGTECLTGSGSLVDGDDPRIDTQVERDTSRPRAGPAPEPGPAATRGVDCRHSFRRCPAAVATSGARTAAIRR